ncbi:MAG: type IV pilus assembly protein PilM [Candidatus Moranbacteria bacterium]|nr:type IV pilus assembly protein PilM [Candidatus Moranbacteria bacterium]
MKLFLLLILFEKQEQLCYTVFKEAEKKISTTHKYKRMFFGLQKSYFLGIDFGTSLIKVVELTLDGDEPKLHNYGQVDLLRLEKGAVSDGNTYDDEVVLYLKALLERFHAKGDAAYVAMPAFIGLISLMELPEMNEDELKEAIPFEAHKYIPSSLDDVALSWEVVGRREATETSAAKMEVLLVAALKKEVARYRGYIEGAKLKMTFLELETFSLVRSVVGNDPGLFLVIDIGSRTTNLVLVDEGVVKMSRNIDAGGKNITRTLTESLHVTVERAEALKKSDRDYLNVLPGALTFSTLDIIADEATRMLAAYKTKHSDKACNGILLSGGSASLTGLVQYYSKVFKLPVSIGDPWRRVKHEAAAALDIKRLGTSFSIALGLALAGIDSGAPKKYQPAKKTFSLSALLHKKI